MEFFGGDEGESPLEVEAHLVAEYAQGAGPGAIFLAYTVLPYMSHQVQILLHASPR